MRVSSDTWSRPPGLWGRLATTDHKTIGLQYGFTSLFFLLVGFALVLIIRWQHAYSGQPLPLIGGIGTRTALVALTLYGVLPIVRTTIAGLRGVDAAVLEGFPGSGKELAL